MEIAVDTNDLLWLSPNCMRMLSHCSFYVCVCVCKKSAQSEKEKRERKKLFKWILKMPIKDAPKSNVRPCSDTESAADRSEWGSASIDWILYLQHNLHIFCTAFFLLVCLFHHKISNASYTYENGMCALCRLGTGQSTARCSTCTMPCTKTFLSP